MVFNSTPKRNIAELEQTIIDLVQRVEDLERDCADNTNFVEGMKALAENPENEGKYFGVKDEMVDIIDAPIIVADSYDDLPDPSDVPEGTIAFVPCEE